MNYIKAVELKIGREIEKNFLPLQAGDVPATYADVSDLVADFDCSVSEETSFLPMRWRRLLLSDLSSRR